ncbi:Aspartate/methionine/tyrosine aminotransferase [Geosmithia morbida]|uniref:Aspartate/methionine/tyrosine aminotransferase n=1 Tax=Geosmithia morbida TaxID=1094350 RepID=A0A9P4YUW6_9HYPO|nr:Aspartate/methionine/tyrosine aminotransferase [Geosmithia morbida]KAF4121454.1 Aspartate/methionine/tyrosine aminotransferase [Geosmithia morbida]
MSSDPTESARHPARLINLQLGWPSPRLFSSESLLHGAQEVLTSETETCAALVYGPHIGHPPLRRSIAGWLSSVYSRPVNFDRLCITNGASGNLSNVLQKFTDPLYTRRIFMVEPTYFLACPIFEDNGFQGKLRGVPEQDDGGLDIEFLRRELAVAEDAACEAARYGGIADAPARKVGKAYSKIYKYIIYVVPTFSNPGGNCMSVQKRKDLVCLARDYDALIVSDDVYDFLSWPERSEETDQMSSVPPRLVDIDRGLDGYGKWGNTLSNGSFSKIIGPGVRVGWADCAPALAVELAEIGSSSSGGAPSHLTSTFVDKMLRRGGLQSHIQNVLVPTYRARYCTLNAAVAELLTPLGVRVESSSFRDGAARVAGGFFSYLRLPDGMPQAKDVAAYCLTEYNLRIAFGSMFAVTGDETSMQRAAATGGFSACIRLCWAWHEEDEIREGIDRLAAALCDIRAMQERGESLETREIGIR